VTLNAVEEIFKRHNWQYQLVEGHLVTGFDGVLMVFDVEPERELVLLIVPLVQGEAPTGRAPSLTPAERDTCVYLATANYGLALGAFTRDHRDGEIRYEAIVPVTGSALTDEQVELMVGIATSAVTFHGPVIAGLLTGRVSLPQALAFLDRKRSQPQQQAV
jgi:hypothetical protein